MTPREILEKYGLKTDVKSVRERLRPKENKPFSYSQFLIKWLGGTAQIDKDFFHNWNDIKNADLDLLCEMAERVEKVEEEYLTLKNICESLDSGDENWKLLVVDHIIDYLNDLKEKELEELK